MLYNDTVFGRILQARDKPQKAGDVPKILSVARPPRSSAAYRLSSTLVLCSLPRHLRISSETALRWFDSWVDIEPMPSLPSTTLSTSVFPALRIAASRLSMRTPPAFLTALLSPPISRMATNGVSLPLPRSRRSPNRLSRSAYSWAPRRRSTFSTWRARLRSCGPGLRLACALARKSKAVTIAGWSWCRDNSPMR